MSLFLLALFRPEPTLTILKSGQLDCAFLALLFTILMLIFLPDITFDRVWTAFSVSFPWELSLEDRAAAGVLAGLSFGPGYVDSTRLSINRDHGDGTVDLFSFLDS
ncbi:hypothetical protein BDZ89DRAFT_1136512 [Hymenopellis radicata]|nr:hypothetical protein BDZ89DRAFT_1136512 [Hymenopellis radicata]